MHEEEVDWSPVTVNLPVREGDRFVLLEDSRMEFEFNEGSFLRLGSDTDAEFHKLGEEKVRIRLNLGGLILRINRSASYIVSTIFSTVGLNGSGLYRIDLEPNGAIRIVVRKGSAKVTTVVSSRTLYEGEVLTIRGPDDSLSTIALSYLKDDFDLWSDRRDALQVAYQATRYLGRCYAGVSDLDRYGSWGYLSIYGHLWWPRAPKSWCPYRNGRWICYPGWGWTWISDEPWGWLPITMGLDLFSVLLPLVLGFRRTWPNGLRQRSIFTPARGMSAGLLEIHKEGRQRAEIGGTEVIGIQQESRFLSAAVSDSGRSYSREGEGFSRRKKNPISFPRTGECEAPNAAPA